MNINWDPITAKRTLDARWERFQGLTYRVTDAIREAIKDQSKDEQMRGGPRFTEAEARDAECPI